MTMGDERAVYAERIAARPANIPLARAPKSTQGRRRAPSREGKRGILIHVEPELSRKLGQIALDEDTTLQALGLEALEHIIESRS